MLEGGLRGSGSVGMRCRREESWSFFLLLLVAVSFCVSKSEELADSSFLFIIMLLAVYTRSKDRTKTKIGKKMKEK